MDLSLFAVVAVVLLAGIQTGDAIWCNSCNSGSDYEGTACGDPMPNVTAFLVNCDVEGQLLKRNYTLCRKFYQDVEGDSRIVRSCATDGREGSCVDRTGTAKIRLRYCECKGDGCNGASTISGTFLVFLGALVLAAVGML
jgi:hypothetical protein